MSAVDALVRRPPSRSLSSCGPSSSCEALRYAVAALNRLDDFYCEKIGAGFFSEVFKVRHRVTSQVMVLKMNTSRSNRANSLREVQLMNRLSHQNILKFMGVCVHEGQLHALTEFINGGSLEQLLQDRTNAEDLSWERRVKLSLDVARGMEYLHSRGVFHRDLTSKNVLIKINGNEMMAVVGDFGLAEKIPDPRDRSQRLPIVGSPYWMAPECLKGEWYNEKADVFSFGIILCEIIARIEADPDVLPRTENFGVDYMAFSEMCPECPPQFLELAFSSCRIDPNSRPSFLDIADQLQKLLNVFSCLSGDPNVSCPPVIYSSCLDDGDNIDSVRAIFAHGWTRTSLPQDKAESKKDCTPVTETPALQVSTPSPVTPKHIGEAMSMQDPHYKPSSNSQNPFASLPRFWKGKKFLEESTSFETVDPSHSLKFDSFSSVPSNPLQDGASNCSSKNALSKSLPTSPVLLKKTIFVNSIFSPRSTSPGPSYSPPSSLSPFEADESFSGYNSVQEQMSDCKLEDSRFIPQDAKVEQAFMTCNSPTPVAFGVKTVKLRRSSGESGFFSVGDRNSACDLLLEQMNDSKMEDGCSNPIEGKKPSNDFEMSFIETTPSSCAKLRYSSDESSFFSTSDQTSACDLSMECCQCPEDVPSWTSNDVSDPWSDPSHDIGRRRKRPSSYCSDESCACCRVHLSHYEVPVESGKDQSLQFPNNAAWQKNPKLYTNPNPGGSKESVVGIEFSSHIESGPEFHPEDDLGCADFNISKMCKKGSRLAKCMRTSPDL
ncbi:dual specificity testis-specific protein kinase 2-like [Uloborus diversus]|uniref:dual specificity testis-specific protein kinase 2-like n=1 Tax=Uloborus diversus TaxID=327109 RepID=UPI00240A6DC7|nr:dual specificity testis-specific protein kinase 2-like [Uloborus diversus]